MDIRKKRSISLISKYPINYRFIKKYKGDNEMPEEKKIRPRKGAMWYQQMTDDYFDIEYENMFEGCSSNARNLEGLIQSYISKNWDKKVRTCVIDIRTSTVLDKLNDDSIDLDVVKDISQKLLLLKRIDQFQMINKGKKIRYEIKEMLDRLDNFSKNEERAEKRKEEIRKEGVVLGVPHSITDSSLDEFVEYIFTKIYTSDKQKEKSGFELNPRFEEYFNKSSKLNSKLKQHTGKENTLKDNSSLTNRTGKNIRDAKALSHLPKPSDEVSQDNQEEVGVMNIGGKKISVFDYIDHNKKEK